MTLPKNVADALESADANSGLALVYMERDDYMVIRAHLLSQEAKIDRLRRALGWHEHEGMTTGTFSSDYHHSVKVARDAANLAESRLAAANALLRECYEWLFESLSDGPRVSEGAIEKHYYTPLFEAFHGRIQAHLQGAGDEGGRPS